MTPEQILGLVLALLVMLVGLIGCVVPGIPSTPLVLIAAIAHKVYFGPDSVGWLVMSTLVGLTLLSSVMDFLASSVGARKLGATRKGMIGAIVGGLVGLCFGFPGVLMGPFIGAVLFEKAGRRPWKEAAWAGTGATVGLLAGALGKAACCVLMMVIFAADVVYRNLTP